jgi:hypothetical protein
MHLLHTLLGMAAMHFRWLLIVVVAVVVAVAAVLLACSLLLALAPHHLFVRSVCLFRQKASATSLRACCLVMSSLKAISSNRLTQ